MGGRGKEGESGGKGRQWENEEGERIKERGSGKIRGESEVWGVGLRPQH